jgi:hypothetical protein
MRTRTSALAAGLAAFLLAGPALTGCGSAGSGGSGSGVTSPTVPTASSASSASSASASASLMPTSAPATSGTVPGTTTGPAASASPAGLVPVWPFTTLTQVEAWQGTSRPNVQQPWQLDADRTALAFCRDHLGYKEIDRVTTWSVSRSDARVGVGWKGEDGVPHTVGEIHLVRFGPAQDAPWVVVGSEDTSLTLTTPRYGATVSSPLTVGGRITGVDESLRVTVVGPASATPLAEVVGIPAGGEQTPWTATLRFAAPTGTVLTVAVSTGGHLMDVERFAITAVRVG